MAREAGNSYSRLALLDLLLRRAPLLARNAITPATSSGVVALPIGRRSRRAAIMASPKPPDKVEIEPG